jgi:hypothetical protein
MVGHQPNESKAMADLNWWGSHEGRPGEADLVVSHTFANSLTTDLIGSGSLKPSSAVGSFH